MAYCISFLITSQLASQESQLLRTFHAVCMVESGGDPYAVKLCERAVGISQIRPILVADVNRILGRKAFRLSDRTDPVKSYQMFRTYVLHYWPTGGPEQWARAWNGGPDGPDQACTSAYWARAKLFLP